jgi:hypothetical protein
MTPSFVGDNCWHLQPDFIGDSLVMISDFAWSSSKTLQSTFAIIDHIRIFMAYESTREITTPWSVFWKEIL